MRKVLFDMTVYQTGTTFHGGGEYSYTVLDALMHAQLSDVQVDVFIGNRGRVDDKELDVCRQHGMGVFLCKNAAELGDLLKSGDYDVLYSASPDAKYFRNLTLPEKVFMIITVHGLRKFELREGGMYEYFTKKERYKSDVKELVRKYFGRKQYLQSLKKEYAYLFELTKNYVVVTDSYHSYYNILRFFPQIEKKRLLMLGCPGKLTEKMDNPELENRILAAYGVQDRNFGLLISANRAEKNARRLIRAWDDAFSECADLIPADFKTVVLGVDNQEKLFRGIQNKERFVCRGYVDAADLETLYKHTHLFVFGSLNEGFGYPPMEAMKYGTLVASSVNTSIPESCGDATLMFNPLVVSEITNRILQSFDPAVREKKARIIPAQCDKIMEEQNMYLGKIVQLITEKGMSDF